MHALNAESNNMYRLFSNVEKMCKKVITILFLGMGQPSQPSTGSSTAGSPLSNSILPPAMTPADEFVGSAAASPLQRMASITNSLISQPSTPSHHSPSQRPLKAVLPPITQQQFDMYNNLNTEEIVKKVSHLRKLMCIFQNTMTYLIISDTQSL